MTEGFRLVVTYNLIFENGDSIQLAAHLGSARKDLEDALAFWRANFNSGRSDCPNMLLYIFEHLYTDSALRYDGLKGNDQMRGQYLRELCQKYDFLFWLASLERGTEGECEDVNDDEGDAWRNLYFERKSSQISIIFRK